MGQHSQCRPHLAATGHHGALVGLFLLERRGRPDHAYKVAELISADTLTATFVPAAPILLSTSPLGLSLTVDGKSN